MDWFKKVNPFVQSISGWAWLVTALLTAFYSIVGFLSPIFNGLHWTEIVLLAIAMSLGTLLVLTIAVALAAWGFRQIRPLPVAPVLNLPDKVLTIVDGQKRLVSTVANPEPESEPEDLSPAGRPWIRLSKAEADAVKDMLLKLDRLMANEFDTIRIVFARLGSAPQKIVSLITFDELATWPRMIDELNQSLATFGDVHRYEINLAHIDLGTLRGALQNLYGQISEFYRTMADLGPDIPERHAGLVAKAARPAAEANGKFDNAITNLRNEIRQTRESIAD